MTLEGIRNKAATWEDSLGEHQTSKGKMTLQATHSMSSGHLNTGRISEIESFFKKLVFFFC